MDDFQIQLRHLTQEPDSRSILLGVYKHLLAADRQGRLGEVAVSQCDFANGPLESGQ